MQDSKSTLKQGTNPQTEGYQQLAKESLTASDKTAKATFEDKNFRDEWRALYAASGGLRWIVSVGSFVTLTACISWGLSFRLPPVLAWSIAVGMAAILEGLKGFLWTKSAKYILKYKSAPALLIGGAALLTCLSLLGGIGGALTAPNSYSEPSDIVKGDSSLVAADLVEAGYLEQLATLDEQAANISATIAKTASNSTKRTLATTQQAISQERSKVSSSLEQHRDQQRKQREVARTKKEAAQAAASSEQLEASNKQRSIAVFLAVLFDLLQIICFVWGVYYLWRVYAERIADQETPQEAIQSLQTPNEGDTPKRTVNVQTGPAQRPQIGFIQGSKGATPNVTPNQTPNVTPLDARTHGPTQARKGKGQTPNVKEQPRPQQPNGLITDPTRERHCNWCGSVYQYKNSTSKFCTPKCRGKMHRYNNQNAGQ